MLQVPNTGDPESVTANTSKVYPQCSVQEIESGGDIMMDGSGGDRDSNREERRLHVFLFPGFMIESAGPMVETNWIIPVSVDQCLVVVDFYFNAEACPSAEEQDEEEWDEDR